MMRKEWERIYWVRHTIRVLLVTRGKVIKMSEAFVSRLDWVGGERRSFFFFPVDCVGEDQFVSTGNRERRRRRKK